jgi:hypothetical protein
MSKSRTSAAGRTTANASRTTNIATTNGTSRPMSWPVWPFSAGVIPSGTSGITAAVMTAIGMTIRMKGIRRPQRVRRLSLHAPTAGLMNRPAMLSKTRMNPVSAGPSPKPRVVTPASLNAGLPACRKTGT